VLELDQASQQIRRHSGACLLDAGLPNSLTANTKRNDVSTDRVEGAETTTAPSSDGHHRAIHRWDQDELSRAPGLEMEVLQFVCRPGHGSKRQ